MLGRSGKVGWKGNFETLLTVLKVIGRGGVKFIGRVNGNEYKYNFTRTTHLIGVIKHNHAESVCFKPEIAAL